MCLRCFCCSVFIINVDIFLLILLTLFHSLSHTGSPQSVVLIRFLMRCHNRRQYQDVLFIRFRSFMFFLLCHALHCLSVPTSLANSDIHELIIFGTNVTESRQSNGTLFSHLTQVVLLHYLAKWTRIASFHCTVALPDFSQLLA